MATSRLMFKALDLYLLRQIMPTLLVTLLVAAIILLLERMLRLLDIAVGNGVSTLVVFQMLFNLIPHYIGLALPAALFLGVLLAFRKLSSQSELDAIQSSGIGLSRFIRWAVILGLLMMIFNLILVGYLQPISRYAYRALLFNVTSGVLESGIGEGVFMDLPNGYTLRVEESRGAGRELFGVFAHQQKEDGTIVTLTAERGRLVTGGPDRPTSLRLFQGNRSEWSPGATSADTVSFDVFDWPLNLADLIRFRVRGGDERELTLDELLRGYVSNMDAERTGIKPAAVNPQDYPEQLVSPAAIAAELHGRIVFSLSILFLPMLAAPLGIMTHRASKSFGLVVGLLTLVVYHKILEFSEAYATVGGVSAGPALWVPFMLFIGGTSYLFLKTEIMAGATPMQRLEDRWSNMTSGLIRLFRSSRG
ncbi:MAG: YjgP/YjgQ family permease [Rhodospirillaceae bacterium]|nr:YjgP/YjgQ family permease [Rhodospirillaceae bacterium]MBT5242058.1 YjgP/YjgQ family permease [Rhodospirillaceae bacterium]MBT6088490.1 YjgP/YjgQ family permease [Rhodospirillaceae bacterium]MBT6961873.1 YjgP/YjgQ family permease [Rhodospirillaceae bacterium]